MANTRNNRTAGKTAQKKEKPIEVKAKDVMAVNEDGTTEKLTDVFPEIGEEETVTVEPESTETAEPVQQQVMHPVYVTPRDPMVKILYLDSCIENNQVPIGGGRIITGSGKIFTVTLSEFEGTFQTPMVMKLLRKRKFIVLDGLTKEQRVQYGVDYREGEIVKNEAMFEFFLNLPVKQAAELFSELCPEHRELVARRFAAAYDKHDNRLTRERIVALNDVSKRDFEDGRGAFTTIIQELNAKAI